MALKAPLAASFIGFSNSPRFSTCTVFGFATVVGVPLPTASSTSALLRGGIDLRGRGQPGQFRRRDVTQGLGGEGKALGFATLSGGQLQSFLDAAGTAVASAAGASVAESWKNPMRWDFPDNCFSESPPASCPASP
jgi:hypothetical protein